MCCCLGHSSGIDLGPQASGLLSNLLLRLVRNKCFHCRMKELSQRWCCRMEDHSRKKTALMEEFGDDKVNNNENAMNNR